MSWQDIISKKRKGIRFPKVIRKDHTRYGFISQKKFKQKLFGEIPWGTKADPKVSYGDLPEDAQEAVMNLVALGDSKISKRKHAKYSIFNILFTYI